MRLSVAIFAVVTLAILTHGEPRRDHHGSSHGQSAKGQHSAKGHSAKGHSAKGHSAKGRPSACDTFCNKIFHHRRASTALATCKSDALTSTGLCFTCGPSAPKGHPDVCLVGKSTAQCCAPETPNCCRNKTCVDLQSDAANCGKCGKKCKNGKTCLNGKCVVNNLPL